MTPEPLTFLDFLIWHSPFAFALVLIVLAIVVPVLVHLNRKD